MTGIIIGRFQVPHLHKGHLHIIQQVLNQSTNVVIFLGCTLNKDDRNPYNISHRKDIIWQRCPQLDIVTLWDRPTDEEWSAIIDEEAEAYSEPVLFHSRDSFRDHYKGLLKLIEIDELPGYSGTKLRYNGSKGD